MLCIVTPTNRLRSLLAGGSYLKILLTTDAYFPMINGVSLSTRNLYEELTKMGHQVRIMTLSQSLKDIKEEDIYYLKSFKTSIYPGARIKVPFLNGMVKDIINWKPEIIHSQTEFSTMVTAKIIRKELCIPQVHTYHTLYEDYLHYILGGKIIKKSTACKITKALLNTFDGVIAPTEKVKEVLKNYEVEVPLYVVPTGIKIDKFNEPLTYKTKEEVYKRYNLHDSDIIIGYVGRIAKEKNLQEIIEFSKSLQNPSIKLMVVGGGPYLQEIKRLCLEYSSNVIFTGMIPQNEIHNYYKLCKVFLTASTSETQGLTYIEALASGCPVVCREDKAASSIIKDNVNGYMYNNEDEFIRCIEKIIYHEDTYNRLSRNAVLSSKDFSSYKFALNILKIYEEIIIKNKAA